MRSRERDRIILLERHIERMVNSVADVSYATTGLAL